MYYFIAITHVSTLHTSNRYQQMMIGAKNNTIQWTQICEPDPKQYDPSHTHLLIWSPLSLSFIWWIYSSNPYTMKLFSGRVTQPNWPIAIRTIYTLHGPFSNNLAHLTKKPKALEAIETECPFWKTWSNPHFPWLTLRRYVPPTRIWQFDSEQKRKHRSSDIENDLIREIHWIWTTIESIADLLTVFAKIAIQEPYKVHMKWPKSAPVA